MKTGVVLFMFNNKQNFDNKNNNFSLFCPIADNYHPPLRCEGTPQVQVTILMPLGKFYFPVIKSGVPVLILNALMLRISNNTNTDTGTLALIRH